MGGTTQPARSCSSTPPSYLPCADGWLLITVISLPVLGNGKLSLSMSPHNLKFDRFVPPPTHKTPLFFCNTQTVFQNVLWRAYIVCECGWVGDLTSLYPWGAPLTRFERLYNKSSPNDVSTDVCLLLITQSFLPKPTTTTHTLWYVQIDIRAWMA